SWHRLGLRLGGGLAGGRRRRAALQGQQERDQVEVLLGRELLPEGLGHDVRREPGHRALRGWVEDLAHDVLRRLTARDVREVRPDRAGADRTGLVARNARALPREDGLTRLRIAGKL